MRSLLIDVDTQHDFCHPDGALFVQGADALLPAFRALVTRAVETRTPIVGSVDSHAFDAWEFAGAALAGPNGERPDFPAHCVKGTAGWLKVPGTMAARTRFVPNVPVDDIVPFVAGAEMVLLEKEVYSLFANPNAEAVLSRLPAERFIVFGVATDYCVRAAALGVVEWLAKALSTSARAGEVWLVADAIAAVDRVGGEKAVAECVARGVRMVTVQETLEALSQNGGAS